MIKIVSFRSTCFPVVAFAVLIFLGANVTTAAPSKKVPSRHGALKLVPETLRPGVKAALSHAGKNAPTWVAAILQAPAAQRKGLAYLLANMPTKDLRTLHKHFVLQDVSLAYAARRKAPWGQQMPEDIFLNYLLPYANVDEARDPWRRQFSKLFSPLVAQCKTPSEAALILNKDIFKMMHVQYSADKRPKPNQSPRESIAAHYASCTGLSVFLIDACRSVGVPARMVGTPLWAVRRGDKNGNNAGNHMWVEIWDGQWHVLGASEVSPLDHTWFLPNAALAYGARKVRYQGFYLHRIYAASFKKSKLWFPLVWNLHDHSVNAEDVTDAYVHRRDVKVLLVNKKGEPAAGQLVLRQHGRLIADLPVNGQAMLILSAGQSYRAAVNFDHKVRRSIVRVPMSKHPVLRLRR